MKVIEFIILIVIIAAAVWAIRNAKAKDDSELNSINLLPSSVGNVVAQMNASQQAAFFAEYQKNKKSLVVAYVCWLIFGVYYFYFRKPGWNIALWIASFLFIGEIWWIVDFFRMPSIRREYNTNVARQALQTLSMGAAFNRGPITPPLQDPPMP
ncbi:MAG: TM2 domain-containing protein [Ferrimicrobium acidiphilum]